MDDDIESAPLNPAPENKNSQMRSFTDESTESRSGVELEDESGQQTFSSWPACNQYLSPCAWLRHFSRALTLNLGNEPIYTKQEQQHLLEAGVEGSTIAYNFLSWRRSCMATTLIPVFMALVISILQNVTGMATLGTLPVHNGTNIVDIMHEIQRVEFIVAWIEDIAQFLSIILVCVALWNWHRYLLSRKLIHFAWSLYFFTPFMIGCYPLVLQFRSKHLTEFTLQVTPNQTITITLEQIRFFLGTLTNQTAAVDQVVNGIQTASQIVIGAYFAGTFFLSVSSQSLSLPLALIRSALTIRGLLPTSALNGNIIKLVTLLFVPLSWSWFLLLIQTFGNFVFIISPIFYSFPAVIMVVFLGKYLIPPMSNLNAAKYAIRIRYFYLVCVVISGVFLWFSFRGIFNNYLNDAFKILELLIDFVGEYFLTAVFAADLVATFLAEDKIGTELLKEVNYFEDPISQIAKLYQNWNY